MSINRPYNIHSSLACIMLLLLLVACGGEHEYQPIEGDFQPLLDNGSEIDSAFVNAITEPDYAMFNAETTNFMRLYYEAIAPDETFAGFSSATSPAARQDTVLLFMQDFLLDDGSFAESIKLGKMVEARAIAEGNDDLHAEALYAMATAAFRLGQYKDAIAYAQQSYAIDSKSGDPELLSDDLNMLAGFCLQANKLDLARDYILESIKLEKPLHRDAKLAVRYGMASEIYLRLNELALAEDYARKAVELDRKGGREAKVGVRLSQLAAVQMGANELQQAEATLNEALPILEKAGNMPSLAITYCQLADIAFGNEAYSQALDYYEKALEICQRSGMQQVEQRALKGMWLSLKDTNPAQGVGYLERYTALADSIDAADTDSQLANLKAEYSTLELQRDKEQLESQNRINKVINIALAAVFVLLCIVAWLSYRHRKAKQRLMQQMEKVRTNFFTNITHEFRTPLTVILGISSELEKTDKTRKQAEIISSEGNHLLNLVNQLLDIGKINSAIGQAHWRHGNVIGYANMLVESLRHLAVSKNVELVFAPESNVIEMDFVPDYLQKIVRNLLSNALKYTPAEGHILMSAKVEGDKLRLRIADNGKGIDAADLEHIFDPFYQGINSNVTVGTGVGLSLVKLLVEAMDGEITVQSSPGIGSVFTIMIPLKHEGAQNIEQLDPQGASVEAPEALDNEVAADTAESDGNRRLPTVLIVEDNVNVANYMASQLKGLYNILIAHNGEEGLARAESLVPDLIITDVMMPVMDGIEMLKRIRQNDIINHLPVIMVTARATQEDRIEGVESGADAYLYKPFNADELRAQAARLIEQRRMLCEKYRAMSVSDNGEADSMNADDRDFISKLVNVVYSLSTRGVKTTITAIADHMRLTERQLTTKVQALTGETTLAFTNRVKIDKAKRMLDKDNDTPLNEVAEHCGFDDPAYFSRIFKQIVGESPTSYRRKIK